MSDRKSVLKKLSVILKDSEILMHELEEERDESLENLRFDGEEELLNQYYKKILISIYRMRNNAAALLLRNNCSCTSDAEWIHIVVDGYDYAFSKQAMKNVLQQDYDNIIEKNSKLPAQEIKTDVDTEVHKEEPVKQEDKKPEVKNNSVDVKPAPKTVESYKETKKATEPVNDTKPLETPVSEPTKLNEQKHDTTPVSDEQEPDYDFTDILDMSMEDTPFEPIGEQPLQEEVPDDEKVSVENTVKLKPASWVCSCGQENSGNFCGNCGSPRPAAKQEKTKEPEQKKTDDNIKKEPAAEEKKTKQEEADDYDFLNFDADLFNETIEDKEPETNIKPNTDTQQAKKTASDPAPANVQETSDTQGDKAQDDFDFDMDMFSTPISSQEQKHPKQPEPPKQTKPVERPVIEGTPVNPTDDEFDLDADIFSTPLTSTNTNTQKQPDIKKQEQKKEPEVKQPSGGIFKLDNKSFAPKKEEKRPEKKPVDTNTKPKFTTSFTSDDPDEILQKLKAKRQEYDQLQLEMEIEEAEKAGEGLEGEVFDLSAGGFKSGKLDVDEVTGKIDKVAEGIVQTSKKDNLMDMRMVEEKITDSGSVYGMQKDSDFKRHRSNFILDVYQLKIKLSDNDGNLIREDMARMIVAPVAIPDSGSALATDICAYLENNGEGQSAVVNPGGKTTIILTNDDYSVFVKGYWENGSFNSMISVIGRGVKADLAMKKKELRPESMLGVGIGHNLIILDHATNVHIIPLSFKNDFYGYTRFMAVVTKDYGIDKDAQSYTTQDEPSIEVKGERQKRNILCKWTDENELTVQSTIAK